MAYNVFKRPMFKRGGSTQGTGIMSHVEPRKQFNTGSPGFTLVGKPYTPGTGSPNIPMDPSKLSNFQKGELARNRVLYNIRNFGNKGLNFLRGAGSRVGGFLFPNATTAGTVAATKSAGAMAAPFAGVAGLAYLNRPKTDEALKFMKEETRANPFLFDETNIDVGEFYKELSEKNKEGEEIGFLDIFKSPDKKVEEDVEKNIKEEKDKKPIVEKIEIPTTKEKPDEPKTFEDTYETEKKRIEKLLGDRDSKGEIALALSEAIGTPGSIADKAAVLNKSLLKLKAGQKAEKRDIAKLAYTATKEIEKAKIMAGKKGYSEKMAEEVRKYQTVLRNPNASEADKKFAQQQLSILKSTIDVISPKANQGLSAVDTKLLDSLGKAAAKVKRLSKDPTSDAYQKALDQYKLARIAVSKNPALLDIIQLTDAQIGVGQNLKDGGRVNRAMGSSEVGETGQVPTAPVQKLSFEELRNRLPKEITDDVIRLISNSEEALQDFAYIRTQGDVDKFNMKYGVNAVLPAQS